MRFGEEKTTAIFLAINLYQVASFLNSVWLYQGNEKRASSFYFSDQ